MPGPIYLRRVSPLERLFIANTILSPPFANQLVIEGGGMLDVPQLQRALDTCSAANPGSTLTLCDVSEPLRWQSGRPPRINRILAPDWDGYSDAAAPFLSAILDPFSGPTCEILLVIGREARKFLIFRSLHAVMDGIGTLSWANDCMSALRGETPTGHASRIIDTDVAQPLTPGRTRQRPPADALHPLGRPGPLSGNETFHWQRVTIPRRFESRVLGVVAATLNNLARENAGGDGAARQARVRFNIPCDLRRHVSSEKTTGNMFGPLFVEMTAGAQSDQFGLQLVRQLHERQELIPLSFLEQVAATGLDQWQAILADLLEQQHQQGRYHFTATLSQLGQIGSASLSCADFVASSAYFVPPLADQVCFVACNGFDRHTEIAIALPSRFCHHDGLPVLSKRVRSAVAGSLGHGTGATTSGA
jgi:hypothetical protein